MGYENSEAGRAANGAINNLLEWPDARDTGDFVFCGRRTQLLREEPRWRINTSQEHYYSDLALRSLRKEDPDSPLQSSPELVTEYRSGIGSLQWLSGTSRPEHSADTSLLHRPLDVS